MKRLVIISISSLIAGGFLLWGFYIWKTRSTPHIAVTGGRPLSILLPANGTHFMQNDTRWAKEKIGGSEETIRSVGCAMCSVASAAQYLGETTDPATFNRQLIAAGGYTEQGWLVWSAVSKIFEKRIEVTVLSHPLPFGDGSGLRAWRISSHQIHPPGRHSPLGGGGG
ncbi:hypothetical protein [Prosthecobacter fusiformis]|uniref:hypothetical protein n=1 Tax=Prosthecobacter fusiformis TaxID=48464 RepID=UPI0010608B54|nr:hypothetical protein [Prosthecobacter fusiformis]